MNQNEAEETKLNPMKPTMKYCKPKNENLKEVLQAKTRQTKQNDHEKPK